MDNYILDELEDEDTLSHIGVAHDENPPGPGSGRYSWGSGENPHQHMETKSLREQLNALNAQGLSDAEAAIRLGFKSTVDLRAELSRQREAKRSEGYGLCMDLYTNKGIRNVMELSRITKIPPETIRSWFKNDKKIRNSELDRVKNELKELVSKDKYLDVGSGTEVALGISDQKRQTALKQLEAEGYVLYDLKQPQISNPLQKTTIKVLAEPGTTPADIRAHRFEVKPIDRYVENEDGTRSVLGLPPVNSVDLNRVLILHAGEGGEKKDGVIELRRGVDDISLGNASYAQVRIGVDGKYYLKGMAHYSDNVPEGYDIVFNSSKSKDLPLDKVLKKMKTKIDENGNEVIDQDNPFGASIKNEGDTKSSLKLAQRYYIDKDGNRQVSALNIVNEEGDWKNWSKNLASQMLSKQPLPLVKQQLDMAYLNARDEFEDVMSIKNPGVRREMLLDIANRSDSAAVDLKAAALPRQQTHVLLPLTSIDNKHIYAPNYKNGEEVVLIRYPHQGTFEIPKLTVNNNNREGKSIIGSAPDAVGISLGTAQKLSGADFDGDTVIVIPIKPSTDPHSTKINNIKIDNTLKELKGFDPHVAYAGYPGMLEVKNDKKFHKQMMMGLVTNLVTDMQIKGAPLEDVAKAVKHAQVIIDAEKHNLDWRRSEQENDIPGLKKKYQGSEKAGASTLISRASSEEHVLARSLQTRIDPETGKKITFNTNEMMPKLKTVGYRENGTPIKDYVRDKDGNIKYEHRTQRSSKMAETEDAYTLLSTPNDPVKSYPVEVLYADYANSRKALAREARLEYSKTESHPVSPTAKKAYEAEVRSLEAKLSEIRKNAPRERQAQLRASNAFLKKKREREDADKDTLKKIKNQCLLEARIVCGAKKEPFVITPKEWEAIENYAISTTKTQEIVRAADNKQILRYALPKEGQSISSAKQARIQAMANRGETLNDIAEALGISVSTVQKYAKG